MKTLPWMALSALSVSSCTSDGALEQAAFGPRCEPEDVVCEALALNAPIAVGATLGLDVTVTTPGVASPPMRMESARPDVANVEGFTVTGTGPGVTALLATTEQGQIIDYVHLWVAEPTRLALHREDGAVAEREELTAPIQLLVNDDVVLSPTPCRSDEPLLGTAEAVWSSSGNAVALLSDGVPGRRRVVAREVGTAVVTVTMLDMTAQLTIEVLP